MESIRKALKELINNIKEKSKDKNVEEAEEAVKMIMVINEKLAQAYEKDKTCVRQKKEFLGIMEGSENDSTFNISSFATSTQADQELSFSLPPTHLNTL